MDFDPYSHRVHEDPYPIYQTLRDEHPVHYNATRDFWTVARWDDCMEALQQPHVFSSGRGISLDIRGSDADQSPMPMMIVMDPPDHDGLRSLVNRAFTPRRVRELEAHTREIAVNYLERFIEESECDLWADFAAPLPTTVIAELLGVPTSDREWFKEKSTEVVSSTEDPEPREGATNPAFELGAYLHEQFQHKRKQPREDLMTALLQADLEGRRLTEPELVGFAVLLLIGGNETTTNLICNAAVQLDRHPEEQAKLAREPGKIGRAIEEFLRFESPIQGIVRTMSRETEFRGQTIPEEAKVMLLVGSANRDPRRIPDPERFDVERNPNRHLAFGFGTHFCLGASLARLEARIAFEEIFARISSFGVSAPFERLHSPIIRGLLSLPLEFERAA
jgi:cytochrome P450